MTSAAPSTALQPSSPRRLIKRLDYLLRKRLWAQILVAMVAGITLGLTMSPSGGAVVSESSANLVAAWLALPGHLFLALIQMVVVAIVLSSIVLGIATSGDTQFLKRIGFRIAPYFVATTALAVVIGSSLALWFEPGQYLGIGFTGPAGVAGAPEGVAVETTSTWSIRTLPEQIVSIIPSNPTQAVLSQSMFQIVVMAIFAAIALVSIAPARAKPILTFVFRCKTFR